ncbi:hypothetical protein I3760_04G181700 [Carya illinoinensis]|nr:hypothetical protein I3760_04G181700 [Carya illinoinensis]
MDSGSSTRRPCFVEGDDGLASLVDMEVGFSGTQHHRQPFLSRLCHSAPCNGNTRNSFRSASVLSPRSGRFYDARLEEHRPHRESTSPNETQDYPFRTSTIAAA